VFDKILSCVTVFDISNISENSLIGFTAHKRIRYTEKRNLIITTKRILFSILIQYLVSITKHNNSNQPFDNNHEIKLAFI